ncbi:hypothetical protein ANCDUO_04834 [Ancylostoma duodenale]|uniref:Uncharacterized protein n=1 Tax=Ancylostoma duodenale TaxID=51022 RepID=A0A0C2GU54_9BILA|nr:hypothetical protein ANCDUO_04834 [Ancylostoma duodenale]
MRRSTLREQSNISDNAAYAKLSKTEWTGHVMRLNDNGWTKSLSDWTPRTVSHTTGRPPTRWSYLFTNSLKERCNALRVPRTDRIHWTTLARERDKWKYCWGPLGTSEHQREPK